MSIAQGNVHPDVWEVEMYLSWRLVGYYDYVGEEQIVDIVGDFLTSEAYELTGHDVDLIDLDWTLESIERTPRQVNAWNLAGNMKVKAYVRCEAQKYAISTLKETLKDTFRPCSGRLTITWNSWMNDVAEGAAA